jgi:hypothetical protein
MATSFHNDASGIWAEQAAGAELDYTLDWTDSLDDGDTIADSQWTADAGLLVDHRSFDDSSVTAWFSGGIGGRSYLVTNTITTGTGRRDSRSFRVFVRNPAGVGAGIASVFGDLPAAIAMMRRDRLMGPQQTYMAERTAEKALRVFLTPCELLPSGATDAERDAFDAAGIRWQEEAGYDHEGYSGNWGALDLRHRPVIDIHEVRFCYPDPKSTLFVAPPEWIRLDKKYGRLQLVPTQSVGGFAVSNLVIASLNAGQTVPLAIQVRYRAGLRNAARDYPDVLNLILKQAVLDTLDDQFMPTGGSSSVDGLSQSMQWDGSKHHKELDAKFEKLRSSLHGIRMAFL